MRVLMIDDEKPLADTLVMILQRKGYEAACAYSGAAALETIASFRPDCVISDVIMPGMLGTELCANIETMLPGCRILLLSGQGSTTEMIEAARAQSHCWELLAKPVDPRELLEKLASPPEAVT
ncbi:MAG: response regulator [Terracidiphilus sp.]